MLDSNRCPAFAIPPHAILEWNIPALLDNLDAVLRM